MNIRNSKTLIVLLTIVILSAGFIIYLISSGKDRMKGVAVTQINELINAKVEVKDISLNWFKEFPYISLDFTGIHVGEPGSPKKTLVRAGHLYLSFNVYDLLRQVYIIKKISLDSGLINLRINQNGTDNFSIFRETNDSSSTGFVLSEVAIRDFQVHYSDEQNQQDYSFLIGSSLLSFNSGLKSDKLGLKAELFVQHIKSGSLRLLSEKQMKLDFEMTNDRSASSLEFSHATLQTGKLTTEIKGTIGYGSRNRLNLSVKTEEVSLQELFSILPFKLPDSFQAYKSSGEISLNGTITGEVSRSNYPQINAAFFIREGKLTEPKTETAFEHIHCAGTFSNGLNRNTSTSVLDLQTFSFSLKHGKVSGKATISSFDKPQLDIDLTGELPVQELLAFQNRRIIGNGTGTARFAFRVKGPLNELSNSLNPSILSSGKIEIDASDIEVISNHQKIRSFNLNVALEGNHLAVNRCRILTDHSDISISGELINLSQYLFNHKQLTANLDYRSDHLDLSRLIVSDGLPSDPDTVGIRMPDRMQLNIHFAVSDMVYHLFHAKELSGSLSCHENRLVIHQLNASAMNGRFQLNAQVDQLPNNNLLVTSTCKLTDITIRELFRQCADFGQNEITYNNLNGILNGNVEMVSIWTPALECLTEKLFANSELNIRNGEVTNYKPLESLSSYANLEDLRNLKFSEINNKINIRNRTIYIPEMDVANNALNITLSGQHTFDNVIDYRLKIKLKELLAGKRKQKDNEFGEVDESGKGLYLYLLMQGPAGNPKISYDKVSVKNKMKQDIKNEQQSIKSIFQKEFGSSKDTLIREKKNDNDELEFEKE